MSITLYNRGRGITAYFPSPFPIISRIIVDDTHMNTAFHDSMVTVASTCHMTIAVMPRKPCHLTGERPKATFGKSLEDRMGHLGPPPSNEIARHPAG